MGLLFPECFKTTPVTPSQPPVKFRDSRTSSSSSSKTLVDVNYENYYGDEDDEDEGGETVHKRVHHNFNNEYIVTIFSKKLAQDAYTHAGEYTDEDDTDIEDGIPTVGQKDDTNFNFVPSRLNTLFSCKNCYNHICISHLIISGNFTGRSGEAYLVSNVINTKLGESEKKNMLTGSYEVCDVNCKQCGQYLGWKYLKAESRGEKYKVGKYVIERALFKENSVLGG